MSKTPKQHARDEYCNEMTDKLKEAKELLKKEGYHIINKNEYKHGYIVIEITKEMEEDIDDCNSRTEGNKDCSECSANRCVFQ